MATTATPYGLRPINEVSGTPYAGATRKLPIVSGYGTNIFYGSVVIINATGTIELCTDIGSAGDPFPAGTIGVFMGCSYTDATMGFVNRQYWPASQVAADALAFIVDDPNVAFQIQGDAAMAQATLGMNAPLANVQSTATGSTATGNSNVALDATTAATTRRRSTVLKRCNGVWRKHICFGTGVNPPRPFSWGKELKKWPELLPLAVVVAIPRNNGILKLMLP